MCDRTDTIREQEIVTGAEGFVEKRFATHASATSTTDPSEAAHRRNVCVRGGSAITSPLCLPKATAHATEREMIHTQISGLE
jgi:hypothetical protein